MVIRAEGVAQKPPHAQRTDTLNTICDISIHEASLPTRKKRCAELMGNHKRYRIKSLYGNKLKVGKTTFASQFPNALLLAFEHGYNALAGVRAADIVSWGDFKSVVQQLKTDAARQVYNTVVVDTMSIAADLCEKFILAQYDIDALGDLPYGQGWNIYKKEFDTPFRELSQLGYGIVFIAHSKDVPTKLKDKDGNNIMGVMPDLNKTALSTANRLVDVIGYMSTEFNADGTNSRFIYTRQTPTIFAGSRYKYLKTKIPLGYNELIDAISEAIEREQTQDGAEVKDKTPLDSMNARSYDEALIEARAVWTKLVAGNNAGNAAKIREIITNVMGEPVKLSDITTDQLPQLERIIAEMKKI